MNTASQIANANNAADLLAIWPVVRDLNRALHNRGGVSPSVRPYDETEKAARRVVLAWKRKAKAVAGFASNEKPVDAVVVYILQKSVA